MGALLFYLCLSARASDLPVRAPLVTVYDIEWLPKPNLAQWIQSDHLPTDGPITGAYVIPKRGAEILVALHRERGWDVTGGHIDPGETPEAAAIRETLEEAGVRVGNLKLFAYQRLFLKGPRPEGYKYPYPLSYQALFIGDVEHVGAFADEEDMIDRAFDSCENALQRVPWIKAAPKLHGALLEALKTQP